MHSMPPLRRCQRSGLLTVIAALPLALPTVQDSAPQPALPVPLTLARAEREAGNPLATYAALLEQQAQYRASPVFAGIYAEVRLNYEEFLGLPFAGEEAMQLPAYSGLAGLPDESLPEGLRPENALSVIAHAAASTRLVIFGEEHHLPQTRSLYEPMLIALWGEGYRYLAAETFTDEVMSPDFTVPTYHSGYYVMDPVFASAVRTALRLGYRLVSYDTAESGPEGDASYRDRTQAQNLHDRVFAQDPEAKLLVFAGRGHVAEVPPADGWTPMASVLKQLSGIDPFTIYGPTMSQRRTREEEHPLYRHATAAGLVQEPVIFVDPAGSPLGPGHCDAWVFWPRVTLVDGRPDWLVRTLGRTPTAIPEDLLGLPGLRLAQAFPSGEPFTSVPTDQVLLQHDEPPPALVLPHGSFRVRITDAHGAVSGPSDVSVP